MKNHLTAEQFEEQVAKLAERRNIMIRKIESFIAKKGKELYDQLSPDELNRAEMREKARRNQHRPNIIIPTRNTRVN
jgi:hypothetical protein